MTVVKCLKKRSIVSSPSAGVGLSLFFLKLKSVLLTKSLLKTPFRDKIRWCSVKQFSSSNWLYVLRRFVGIYYFRSIKNRLSFVE